MGDKVFTTLDQQIDLLKSRGVVFKNEERKEKLGVISIDDITSAMGFPKNWRDLTHR